MSHDTIIMRNKFTIHLHIRYIAALQHMIYSIAFPLRCKIVSVASNSTCVKEHLYSIEISEALLRLSSAEFFVTRTETRIRDTLRRCMRNVYNERYAKHILQNYSALFTTRRMSRNSADMCRE